MRVFDLNGSSSVGRNARAAKFDRRFVVHQDNDFNAAFPRGFQLLPVPSGGGVLLALMWRCWRAAA